MLQYLSAHGQHIGSLDLEDPHGVLDFQQLGAAEQLPHEKLKGLSNLRLKGFPLQLQTWGGFQGVLGATVPIRKLELHSCTLQDGEGGLVAALVMLPELRHLGLVGNSSLKGVSFPSNILQTLQHLTYLETASGWLQDAGGMWPLQGLTRLQDLRLNCLGRYTIEASMLSGMAHLTRLSVGGGCGRGVVVEPGVLAGKTQLQHLELVSCSSADGSAGVAMMLSHLQDLQGLTYLSLRGSLDNITAADYSALTASSKLQHLDISQCTLPDDVWEHVFPAGMHPAWLPHLRSLHIDRLRHPAGGPWWTVPAAGPEISHLVSCCPGLRSLDMWRLQYSATSLAALTGLSNLTELHVCPAGASTGGLAVVCQLTGLRQLHLTDPKEDERLLLQLTQLRQLTKLDYCSGWKVFVQVRCCRTTRWTVCVQLCKWSFPVS
jgi:hypothetical protein